MRTIKPDDQIAVLRGDQGNQLVWGNWRQKDDKWYTLDVQIESSWYVAILSIEFSADKLKAFYRDLQDYDALEHAEFSPEYGDNFGLSLTLKRTGNSTTKGYAAARHPFPGTPRITYEFEVEFSAVLNFTKQIGKLVS